MKGIKPKPKLFRAPFVNAAAWLLPVSTINTIGGFDPIFFHYGEDNNYCQRILYHNLKIGVVLGTFIRHDREKNIVRNTWTIESALKKREKELKVNWANINIEFKNQYKFRKHTLWRKFISALLKFNMQEARYRYVEIKLINKIVLEIIKSKKINSKKERHYINEL